MLYGTSRRFLEVFGLASLEDLPSLRDLEEMLRKKTDLFRFVRQSIEPHHLEDPAVGRLVG